MHQLHNIIIIYINNDAVIIMEDSNSLFFSSKFPWSSERISSKFIDNLGTRPRKGSPDLE